MRVYSIALLIPLLFAGERQTAPAAAEPAVAPPRVLMLAGRVLIVQPDTNFVEVSREFVPGVKENGGCGTSATSTRNPAPAAIILARDTVTCDAIISRGYFKRPVLSPTFGKMDSAGKKADTLLRSVADSVKGR